MNYLIEAQSQLTDIEPLFAQLKQTSGVVAVDTEFLREKTYNAKLCLIQLGIGEDQYCIDVLAIPDLSSIKALLMEPSVLKLFHAARQDLEVLYQTFGMLPTPIFDTQLAAAFCGSDMQIGYAALVQDITGVELPKTQSRTDWTRRPLSKEQLQYAGEDVEYLAALHCELEQRLEAQNKTAWYTEEIITYYDVDKYQIDPELAYKRLSGGNLSLKQQYLLKALAAWRESCAQARDIPRSWVVRDDKLYDLVMQRPTTEEQIRALQAFGRKSANYLVPQALEVIQSTKTGEARLWRRVEPLSKPEKAVCSKLMKEVANKSKTLSIAQALLGTRKDIEYLFRHRQSKKLLRGWRKTVIGEHLVDYLRKLPE
ncbi:ribonuclease D [Arenicella chitinivorans]|uniref:Ribonuclease D n=1 Tax=Arenicella chitinivorans TaxID=1329800 RepID=A0A918RY80_9GAMM|nr:ribonuclease D [Arenicella chitinivorans]GHA15670.1 ribonuclease D [Arenicella chitinivorans]